MKPAKFGKFYWKFDKQNKPKFSKTGSVTYSEINKNCKIKLNPNKFILCIEFLQLLPSKELDWVYKPNEDKTKSSKSMKMMYRYVKMKQYYSISDFPEVFTFPVSVIWYCLQKRYQIDFYTMPNISQDFVMPDIESIEHKGPESG